MSLEYYDNQFSDLRLRVKGGQEKSPHKVALLLGVIDLVENGEISKNQIHLNANLEDAFGKRFQELAGKGDAKNPHYPFFHLRSSGFWHHGVKPGKRESYQALSTVSSKRELHDHVTYAYLDDELFELLQNQYVRNALRSALRENLDKEGRRKILKKGNDWDWIECESLVSDYFEMLKNELAGVAYNKADHRRYLKELLNNRPDGSIEFKHRNVSAILVNLGMPYIPGYKPAFNYQDQLRRAVIAYLTSNPSEFEEAAAYGETGITDAPQVSLEWDSVFDPEVPEVIPEPNRPERGYIAKKTNFTERENRNRELGEEGEELALRLEKNRLQEEGRPDLIGDVTWVSKEEGDGAGYDIRSVDPHYERLIFIEVKTTKSGKYSPFFVSENERAFSVDHSSAYFLYRIFNFGTDSRLFVLRGSIDSNVTLLPEKYKAVF